MDDPFNILGSEFDVPPSFDEAVRAAVVKLEDTVTRYDALAGSISAERFTEEEWRIVESAAEAVEEAVQRAEDAYVAVAYDSHAWYRIMENIQQVQLRLESAIGLMERVAERG
jgi:flavin-binding protein dodecin